MRSIMLILLLLTGAARAQQAAVPLDTNKARFSYSVGADLAGSLKPVEEFVDFEALAAGLREVMSGQAARLTDEQREAAKKLVADVLTERAAKNRAALAARNQKEADEFLAKKRTQPGIGTTPSGLQYQVLQPGQELSPLLEDSVDVRYTGTLPNGKVFDSSKPGEVVHFLLREVIPGWTEGLQLMKKGGKFRFFVPPALAYGERGAGAHIGPNQLLIFEVELVEIYGPQETDPKAGVKPAEGHPNFN